MCGIAGFVGQRAVAPETRRLMLEALKQRGPDATHEKALHHGERVGEDAAADTAFLHRRLSIRDVRSVADQPMESADGLVWLSYNGEVYGWEEEAAELQRQGHVFKTRTDSEFILNAYLAWGFPGLLQHLRGMFAFAILDRRQGGQKLILVRDRLGLKPLVYGQVAGGMVFASTVRAALPYVPAAARHVSTDAIDAYLAHRYVPAPRTIFSALQRLENAHWLIYDAQRGRIEKQCYWQPERSAVMGDNLIRGVSSGSETVKSALTELQRAVALRTVADRPLGVFLSGGIDSSAIACVLADEGKRDLSTFTAAFPGTPFDESAEAAMTAHTLGLKHVILPVPIRLGDDFSRIVADLDEPFADPSSFPSWYLAREAVRHVTVVLGGDGGDEVLAGYKRHAKHLRTHFRHNIKLPLPSLVSGAERGLARWVDEMRMAWANAYSLRFSGFSPAQRRYLQAGAELKHAVWWRKADSLAIDFSAQSLHALLSIDFANALPEYILRKADLCTMAHGLELRAPLLDHLWLEKLFQVPDELRFTQPAKQILSPLMTPLAGFELFQRKKRGFNPPLSAWLQQDLLARRGGLGSRLSSYSAGFLNARAVDRWVSAYYEGRSARAEQVLQLFILDESLRQLHELQETLP